jgi:hypothetical protein
MVSPASRLARTTVPAATRRKSIIELLLVEELTARAMIIGVVVFIYQATPI